MNDEQLTERLRTLGEHAPQQPRRSDDELVRGVMERVAQRRTRRRTAVAALVLIAATPLAWFSLRADQELEQHALRTQAPQIASVNASGRDSFEIALASSDRMLQRVRRHHRQSALEARRREVSVERPSVATWVEARWLLREEDLRAANKQVEADALRATRLARFPKTTADEQSTDSQLVPLTGEQQ